MGSVAQHGVVCHWCLCIVAMRERASEQRVLRMGRPHYTVFQSGCLYVMMN